MIDGDGCPTSRRDHCRRAACAHERNIWALESARETSNALTIYNTCTEAGITKDIREGLHMHAHTQETQATNAAAGTSHRLRAMYG